MTTHLNFAVWSSDRTRTYSIEACETAGSIRFSCDCDAGAKETLCRHRAGLLSGELDALASGNADDVKRLYEMLSDSRIAEAFATLVDLEQQAEALKGEIARQKKKVARLMKG